MVDPLFDYKELHTDRASGILLPLFSLPSSYGIGSLGEPAYAFIDFLKTSRQRYWQLLPLGPTGYGNSPYSCMSSSAGNPYFIDLDFLMQENLLTKNETAEAAVPEAEKIDYGFLYHTRLPLLKKAYHRFYHNSARTASFKAFCDEQAEWLADYALFSALRHCFKDTPWYSWPHDVRSREPESLAAARETLRDDIDFTCFIQYLFDCQWGALKIYAEKSGVKIIGDIPIYCAHDSVDVWAYPEVFCVQRDGSIAFVGGCPPADFERQGDMGQVWGTPVYNWDYLRKTDYAWMLARFKRQAAFYDVLRLDHFRGYERFWQIPFGHSGRIGSWEAAGGEPFFLCLKEKLPSLHIIAEDLGYITKEVFDLRRKYGYPSMRILQQGLNPAGSNEHTPHHYDPQTVVYFGIHDNEPLSVWLSQRTEKEKAYFFDYFNMNPHRPVQFELMKAMAALTADTVMYQVQDMLFLDTHSRINVPGTTDGNWEFMLTENQFQQLVLLSDQLAHITVMYGRASSD